MTLDEYKKKNVKDSGWEKHLSDLKISWGLGKGSEICHEESSDRQQIMEKSS